MKANTVDTPRAGAWYTQVNKPGVIPRKNAPSRVILKTLPAKEGRALAAICHGKG